MAHRADPSGAKIADNHYNRQKVGSKQFVPPGRCIVLVIPKVALWVTVRTKTEGHLVFQMLPGHMPPAHAPLGATDDLFARHA